MADNNKINDGTESVESTDRGLFDFMKKKENEDVITSGVQNMHVSQPEPEHKPEPESEPEFKGKEEEKKHGHGGLFDKLHRSDSSSSSSSDEEGDDEEKKKKKKEKKKKMEEKLEGHKEEHDTNVPIEKVDVQENHQESEEEKGGFLDKIKEKLPGKTKTTADHEVAATTTPVATTTETVVEQSVEGEKEKKGFLEKIKEKIPGFHPKSDAHHEEKKDHD